MTIREAWDIIKRSDVTDWGNPGMEYQSPQLQEAMQVMDRFVDGTVELTREIQRITTEY